MARGAKTLEDIQVLIKKLAESINPSTGKRYTNPEIIEEARSRTGKTMSRRTVSRYSGREHVKGETIDEVKKFLSENNLSTDGEDKQLRKRKYNFVQQLRKNSSQEGLIPVHDYFYEDELIDLRKRGLSIDSPEVQKFIDRRTKDTYRNVKQRSKVYSYETVDGLPDGEIKPESKKLVASLFEDSDAKEIRALVRDAVEKQTRIFFQEGKLPDVDDLDHIFPHGSVKIINDKLVGGAFSPDGVFQGVGLTNRKNLQALSRALNRSSQNILTPEKLAQLGIGKFNPSTPEGSLAQIQQRGQWQRGETDASGKPVRKPIARHGAFLSHFPWVGSLFTLGMAGLPGTSEAKTTMGRVEENLTDPYFWGDMVTGFDTKGLLGDMQESHLERHGETYSDRAKRSVVGSAFSELMDYAKKKKDNLFEYQSSGGGGW